MNAKIGGLLLASLASLAFGQQAVVSVVVMEKTVQKPVRSPFASVGLFQVFRGGTKVEKASCPDYSNKDGKLSCIIPCSATDNVPGNFSIVPPDSGPRVRGYVAPPSKEVEVLGCKVTPNTPREFEYVDSLFALNELLRNEPMLAQLASTSGTGKASDLGTPAKVLPVFAELARKPDGLAKVNLLRKLTALAAEKPQFEAGSREAQNLMQYSVGASNVLLKEIARKNLGTADGGIRITGTTADYYFNLKTLEVGLESKMGRTPAENLLLNDVQTLGQQPFKPSVQPQIQKNLKIQ